MLLKFFILNIITLAFLSSAKAGEWRTAKGEYCINRCKYDNKEHYYYWCQVSDLTLTYSDGKTWWWGSSSDKTGPGTRLKWDYCVPSEIPSSPFQGDPTTGRPPYNKGNLPSENEAKRSSEGISYSKGPMSVLYPLVECSGGCIASGPRTVCDVKGNHPLAEGDAARRWFYCVDEQPFVREQISAVDRMWCLDRCRKEGSDHFWCTTLYGRDHCSPSKNVGSKGTRCVYPCEGYETWLEGKYHFCYTNQKNTTWEYCGLFDVPEEKKSIIEFTRYDYVCGDYCRWDKDNKYQYCYYVWWDYNSTINTAFLTKSWDYCKGYEADSLSGGAIAGIIIGCIVGVVLLAFLFSLCMK